MIGRLAGRVLDGTPEGGGLAVIDPHWTSDPEDYGGVGYEVRVPMRLVEGVFATLHVRTIVSETDIRLFGFHTKAQRALFDKLLGVHRVGPAVALPLIAALTPAELAIAVAQNDVKRLAKVKGVGAKTAATICLELGKKLLELVGVSLGDTPPDAVDAGTTGTKVAQAERDFHSGLKGLGFTADEIKSATARTIHMLAAGDLEGAFRDALREKGKRP